MKCSWCGPCHTLSPVLERLTSNSDIQTRSGLPLDLVKVNTENDDGLSLGQKFKVCANCINLTPTNRSQVRALPTLIAFRDGEPVDQFVGALNEPAVRDFLRNI